MKFKRKESRVVIHEEGNTDSASENNNTNTNNSIHSHSNYRNSNYNYPSNSYNITDEDDNSIRINVNQPLDDIQSNINDIHDLNNKYNSLTNATINSFMSVGVDDINVNKQVLTSEGDASYLSTNYSRINKSSTAVSLINYLSSDKIVFFKNQLKMENANFSGYSICEEGAKKISEMLLSMKFAPSPNKRNSVKLKELKFTNSGINDESFKHLGNALEKCKRTFDQW